MKNGQTTPTQQYIAEKAEEAIEEAYTAEYLVEQKTKTTHIKSLQRMVLYHSKSDSSQKHIGSSKN